MRELWKRETHECLFVCACRDERVTKKVLADNLLQFRVGNVHTLIAQGMNEMNGTTDIMHEASAYYWPNTD